MPKLDGKKYSYTKPGEAKYREDLKEKMKKKKKKKKTKRKTK
jgi:hypothetical protein